MNELSEKNKDGKTRKKNSHTFREAKVRNVGELNILWENYTIQRYKQYQVFENHFYEAVATLYAVVGIL